MIIFKEIIWKEETVDCTDRIYWIGYMNDRQVASIHNWDDDFSIFDHIGKGGMLREITYPTFEEAKQAAKEIVETYLIGFIDESDNV